jgi:hypothetical protein
LLMWKLNCRPNHHFLSYIEFYKQPYASARLDARVSSSLAWLLVYNGKFTVF